MLCEKVRPETISLSNEMRFQQLNSWIGRPKHRSRLDTEAAMGTPFEQASTDGAVSDQLPDGSIVLQSNRQSHRARPLLSVSWRTHRSSPWSAHLPQGPIQHRGLRHLHRLCSKGIQANGPKRGAGRHSRRTGSGHLGQNKSSAKYNGNYVETLHTTNHVLMCRFGQVVGD